MFFKIGALKNFAILSIKKLFYRAPPVTAFAYFFFKVNKKPFCKGVNLNRLLKLKIALSHEQYFLKQCFLGICRCVFKPGFTHN